MDSVVAMEEDVNPEDLQVFYTVHALHTVVLQLTIYDEDCST